MLQVAGKAAENGYFTNHWAPDDRRPAARAFAQRYPAEYGAAPTIIACLAYDAANLMLDAVRRAGSGDGAAIRDALRTTGLATLAGRLRFDAERNPAKPGVIQKLQNGRAVFLGPVEP